MPDLTHSDFQKSTKTARLLLAYLIRAIVFAIRRDAREGQGIEKRRLSSLSSELETVLIYSACSERSVLEFLRAVCRRFDVNAAGDEKWPPLTAWLPEGRIIWSQACSAIDYADMRRVVNENPQFITTFACNPPDRADEVEVKLERELFDTFDDTPRGAGFRPRLPGQLLPVRSYRTVWTLTSPMAHGADEKAGNVNLFRRHRVIDALTGEYCYVPFMAGNAVRGLLRDLAMSRWCELIGLEPKAMHPDRVHALFAGGALEAGADTSGVNLTTRRAARAQCPPFDLLGGCVDQQIMQGRLRVHDAVLVCRENAWLAHSHMGHTEPIADFAASLPEASTLTELRQGTRMAHREFDGCEGSQMIFQVETLLLGCQMLHSFQLVGLDGINPVTASCLADLLEEFRRHGTVGAGSSRGFGLIAFDPYRPGPDVEDLQDPELYVEHCREHGSEMAAWAMSAAEKPAPSKRGRKAVEST